MSAPTTTNARPLQEDRHAPVRGGVTAVMRHHFLVPSRQSTGWGVVLVVWALSLLAGVLIRAFTNVDLELINELLSYNQTLFWWGGIALMATLIAAVAQGCPLLMGMGLTRNQVWGGSVLYAAAEALIAAGTVAVLCLGEWASDGWFLGLRPMSSALWEGAQTPAPADLPVVLLTWAVIFWAAQVLGLLMASLWLRWGAAALVPGVIAAVLVVGGLLTRIRVGDSSFSIEGRFDSVPGLMAAVLALGVAMAAGGWAVFRRANIS